MKVGGFRPASSSGTSCTSVSNLSHESFDRAAAELLQTELPRIHRLTPGQACLNQAFDSRPIFICQAHFHLFHHPLRWRH